MFRVLLVVLAFFGGIGLLIYAAAWLFLPADGDMASPVEALIGRGQSSTSPTKTVLIAVGGLLALAFVLDRPNIPLLAIVVVGVVLFLRQRQQTGGLAAMAGGPRATVEQPGSAPPPFAPHGPYAGTYSGQPPPYVPPPYFPPPRKVRQRSPLGRIVLSAMLLVLGVMAAVDQVHGVSITAPAYVATALAVVGAGLVAGAWFGRARGLIALGLLLCLALAVTSAASHVRHIGGSSGNRVWTPGNAQDINAVYRLGAGDATLDLTHVSFTDASATTTVHLGAGQARVLLPAAVDATVHASTGLGALDILGKHSDGTGLRQAVTDTGSDGTGGGRLELFIDDGIGHVEVTRE